MPQPAGKPTLNRLSANLEVLIRRCPRPILGVPQAASPLDDSLLLAYDVAAPKPKKRYLWRLIWPDNGSYPWPC